MRNGSHLEDKRPWGSYEVLSETQTHKVKRIVVYPGKRTSLQSHRRRSEHWHFVGGNALVEVNGDEMSFTPGMSVDIPCGARHRITNTGNGLLVFIEVQTGDYFGEDDIERFEDDFGRVE
ncbi:phosphomannose isomerase type II C-terminal cupin domain [Candidatus Latescibacterota bacterium]